MKRKQGDLSELVKRLAALQERARVLGICPGDRELLECPGCGLQEDVAIGGQLLTCLPSTLGQDTDLRFEELAGDRFRCPRCGTIVQES
jgi:uncharacterized C2H2 Zn-finger protein